LRTQARRALRRQKALAMAVAATLAWGFGMIGADTLNRQWSAPAVSYEKAAMSLAPAMVDTAAFGNTRVIAVTDETVRLLTDLGREANLEGVDSNNWYSSRRLH